MTNKEKVILWNLKNQIQSDFSHLYKINNIIGRAHFINNDQNLLVSGNANYVSLIDIEKKKSSKIGTKNFVNNHFYCEKYSTLSLALDNDILQVIDMRSPKDFSLLITNYFHSLSTI